jgi:hypothetical protein
VTSRPAVIAIALLLFLAIALAVTAEQAHGDRGRDLEAQEVVNAIADAFGAGPTGACFWRIAWRESRLDPTAANLTDRHADGSRGSFGALQIGALWRRHGETVAAFARRMRDPVENARLARRLYDRYGLAPWGGRCG